MTSGLLIIAFLAVVDLLLGVTTFVSLVVIGPFVASAFVGPTRTGFVALVAFLVALALGIPHGGGFGRAEHIFSLVFVAFGGVLAGWLAAQREERERALARLTRVAEVAQQAILRPLPPVVGDIAFAGRYQSATAEASMGGDFYEALGTPHGVRAVVGDVRGKGLGAIQVAATMLGSFREAAYLQSELTAVAKTMEASALRQLGDEDFVTLTLVEFCSGDEIAIVNCGHPPPLRLSAAGVECLAGEDVSPPLGLGSDPVVEFFSLGVGERILLYTDGVIEARSPSSVFFDLAGACGACASAPDLEAALDELAARLNAHAGGRLADDVALLLAERLPH